MPVVAVPATAPPASPTLLPPTLTPLPPATATATVEPSPTATLEPSPTPTLKPSPSATPAPDAELLYEVQPGDTADGLARTFGLPAGALLAYNGIAEPSDLLVGAALRIPTGRERLAAMRATATAAAVPPTPLPPPVRAYIDMGHAYQKPNNCAPATASMIVNTFGLQTTQFDLAALQKPVPQDVNVTAEEVAASVRELGLEAYVGLGGDIDLIERLIAAGFPVMTEEWMFYDGGMGHFRAIRGYDREKQVILHNDSYYGPDQWRTYEDFLRDWRVFNNKFVIIYPPSREAEVKRIIGRHWDEEVMYERLLANLAAQADANPDDGYAWWGMGEALVRLGRPEEAVQAFERATATGTLPWRYLWYRYGYFEALNQTGRYEELLAVTAAPLAQMKRSEDIRYHRAVALRALGRVQEAHAELQAALADNPRFMPATALLSEIYAGQG